jgi:hypothetical protein
MGFLQRLGWIAGIAVLVTWVFRDPAGASQFAKSIEHAVTAGAAALGTLTSNLTSSH